MNIQRLNSVVVQRFVPDRNKVAGLRAQAVAPSGKTDLRREVRHSLDGHAWRTGARHIVRADQIDAAPGVSFDDEIRVPAIRIASMVHQYVFFADPQQRRLERLGRGDGQRYLGARRPFDVAVGVRHGRSAEALCTVGIGK